MHTVEVDLSGRVYRVYIREGVLDELGPLTGEISDSRKALLVSDTKVYSLFGERCVSSLQRCGWQVSVSLIRPGERSKTLTAAGRLYDAALDAGLDRISPVIALGGGVVGDLAGFAAATYLRGVPLVAVPTTLLAQVDSSVGGKTAVNHARGKNLIGAFHQPSLVLSDPASLNSLPMRQLRAGAAEVIKYAIIGDSAYFTWLEQNLTRFWRRDCAVLAEAVSRSVRAKAAVVEQDERESSYRRILNFGHTLGHALESATGYRHYLHGEAVLIGMAAATELARLQGMLDADSAGKIEAMLRAIGFRKPPAGLSTGLIIDQMRYDKKRLGDELLFVLPLAIGSVNLAAGADLALLRQVTASYLAGREPFHQAG